MTTSRLIDIYLQFILQNVVLDFLMKRNMFFRDLSNDIIYYLKFNTIVFYIIVYNLGMYVFIFFFE